MMPIRGVLISLTFVLCFYRAQAQEQDDKFNCEGFIDTYHSVRDKGSNDFLSSRTRLRTELSMTKGNSYFFTSLNSVYNNILPDQTKIELREAYLDYSLNNLDIKIGRQIIIWGNSDAVRISDLISPIDMTEFLTRDYDDIRMPVDALRVKYLYAGLQAELVFIPVSSYYILPYDKRNAWSLFNVTTDRQLKLKENTPEARISNSEIGGRLSFYLSGIDFSVSALHTWNKIPVFSKSLSEDKKEIEIMPHYSRLDMLSVDFSLPIDKFILRGEFAEYLNELQMIDVETKKEVKMNTNQLLIGLDYYPGDEWTLMAQYSQKYVPNYTGKLMQEKYSRMSTICITKKLFRSTFTLSTFSYLDISNESHFNRSYIDYALSDNIHVFIGYDYLGGDSGMFGMYKNNSEYWFKAKYSF